AEPLTDLVKPTIDPKGQHGHRTRYSRASPKARSSSVGSKAPLTPGEGIEINDETQTYNGLKVDGIATTSGDDMDYHFCPTCGSTGFDTVKGAANDRHRRRELRGSQLPNAHDGVSGGHGAPLGRQSLLPSSSRLTRQSDKAAGGPSSVDESRPFVASSSSLRPSAAGFQYDRNCVTAAHGRSEFVSKPQGPTGHFGTQRRTRLPAPSGRRGPNRRP